MFYNTFDRKNKDKRFNSNGSMVHMLLKINNINTMSYNKLQYPADIIKYKSTFFCMRKKMKPE